MNPDHNLSFLFIPDISGFTNFVNETEVSHSQHIISELLEIIIHSDQLGLQPAEIEGDAVLFYKMEVPNTEAIFQQAKKMYINFHHHLRKYETLRICQCGACRTASDLSLKFIAHAGPISFINVDKFNKPFGKAVVTAHKLLKNAVPGSEYLLITDDLINRKGIGVEKEDDLQYIHGEDPAIGIYYRFMPLTFLNELIPPVEHFIVPQKTSNPIQHEIIIDKPVEEIHPLLIDLEFKKKWNRNINHIEYDDKIINQAGFSHTCIVDNKKLNFQTITNDFGSEKWVYGEKLNNPPYVEEADFYYILEKIDPNRSLLKFELHYKPLRGLLKVMSFFFVLIMKKIYTKNFLTLKKVVEGMNNLSTA